MQKSCKEISFRGWTSGMKIPLFIKGQKYKKHDSSGGPTSGNLINIKIKTLTK